MGEAEHTPGPLHVIEAADESHCCGIVGPGCQLVAYIGIEGRPNAANARLFAASPELFDACCYCLGMLEQTSGKSTVEDRIGAVGGYHAATLLRAAIAKARGTKPEQPDG